MKASQADIRLRKGHSSMNKTQVNSKPLKSTATKDTIHPLQWLLMQSFNSFQKIWAPVKPSHMDRQHWLIVSATLCVICFSNCLSLRFSELEPCNRSIIDYYWLLCQSVIRFLHTRPQTLESPARNLQIGQLSNPEYALYHVMLFYLVPFPCWIQF